MIGNGFQDTLDVVELHLLDLALARGRQWQDRRAHIVGLFRNADTWRRAAYWRGCRNGFALTMSGYYALNSLGCIRPADLPAPFGWRWERDPWHDAYLLMPLWIYYVRWLWLRRWLPCIPFIRLGFLQGDEGGLISAYRWSWRWWDGNYSRIRHGRGLYPRWTALGRRLAAAWDATMPRWP